MQPGGLTQTAWADRAVAVVKRAGGQRTVRHSTRRRVALCMADCRLSRPICAESACTVSTVHATHRQGSRSARLRREDWGASAMRLPSPLAVVIGSRGRASA